MGYKIKRLLIIALAIVILALAADSGYVEDMQRQRELAIQEQNSAGNNKFPSIVIDPNIIDKGISDSVSKAAALSIPEKVVVAPRPLISAEAYLVGNLETGEVYTKHNPQTVFPIASLSKLVAALVARQNMPPDQKITITQSMLDAYGEAGHLVLGETLTVSELMYPLLLESSNDAAEALAQSYGYDAFIQKMNVFVADLGMSHTSFMDASGLNPGNMSSANDLFILARYLYLSQKPLLDITRTETSSLASTTDHGAHTFNTINPFPLDPNFIGGKTGRTNEAKESMISLFRYNFELRSYPVAIVVLRSDFSVREIDSSILFEQFINKIH